MNFYDLIVKDTKNNDVSLTKYQGKVLLIVNTATGCGFTPQYKGLEELYKKHKKSGFEILDFPCNQFLGQAPGTNEEIVSFCQLKYGVTFETFSKIKVNGNHQDPLFRFLKDHSSENVLIKTNGEVKKQNKSVRGTRIKWNFTKFIVNKEGKVVKRFEPSVTPSEIESYITSLL